MVGLALSFWLADGRLFSMGSHGFSSVYKERGIRRSLGRGTGAGWGRHRVRGERRVREGEGEKRFFFSSYKANPIWSGPHPYDFRYPYSPPQGPSSIYGHIGGVRLQRTDFGGDTIQSIPDSTHLVRTQALCTLLSALPWPYSRTLLPRNIMSQIIIIWLRNLLKMCLSE